jgi:hypothetical protein
LDKLTQEVARMASTELQAITHNIDSRVMSVDGRVMGVVSDVMDVNDRGASIDVHFGKGVPTIDDQSDHVNRSLSL